MEAKTKKKFPESKQLNLPAMEQEILKFWEQDEIFNKSITSREGNPAFTFYEGPPSANGAPGIHHVLSRSLKDIFCRYKTLKGFQVKRKGGWDTHGLPVELQVEKKLGITKEDIGTKISIEEYNQECRKDVLKFKDMWDDLTTKMGYWVDLDDPYVTFENDYIESVWNLLKRLYDKDFLYKGFTIQPYSPAAGTGLSSHELNLPGTYKDVKDTTCVAQFRIKGSENDFFLAWTTTPWTLPANTALAVGKKIDYVKVRTFNPYTHKEINVILAKALMGKYFPAENAELAFEDYEPGDKKIPYEIIEELKGEKLTGTEYEQLLPFVQPDQPAFRVIHGDFVSTEDGTGIVHIAPTFGSDDFLVAKQNDIPPLLVEDEDGNSGPIVDRQGRYVPQMGEFAGRYVKNYTNDPEYISLDIDICVKLKKENRAFKVEKYEHSYPHCWRTDKPVLYYPLDSWFVRTTAVKDKLVEHNKTINWKPASTGTGRFGNWLENLVDWNLSRSRYWGIPLPIWATEDKTEKICIGSVEQLREEAEKAVAAGVMDVSFLDSWEAKLDLHRPWIDEVVLVSALGKPMRRESDLIDVWFDSGSMPFAQWHYPFENKEVFERSFPADFIAEGVDQTRGWFFTLHAIAVMLEDSVAYKNVIANGLVLDKHGNKMSKRLGNSVNPFDTLKEYGADATRWYMIGNTPPWENLKFDLDGIGEVRRRFFGTLYNTYGFFALYANVDGFDFSQALVPYEERDELDRWIISLLNTLVKKVDDALEDYDPTRAVREIDQFVVDNLSNWYIRLSRRRFWKGEMNGDKVAAYQTLYECLVTISKLMSPVAPFYSEQLFRNLNEVTGREEAESVHLAEFPVVKHDCIDTELEERMELAQEVTYLVRSIRKKEKLKVRQPLQKVLVPADSKRSQVEAVRNLVLEEVNVKSLEFIGDEGNDFEIVRKAKANFRALGPKVGKQMKAVAAAIQAFGPGEIETLLSSGEIQLELEGGQITLTENEVEIVNEDIPGWAVASGSKVTIALDIQLTDSLKREGMARDLVNRIQNLRKDIGLEVTDRIEITLTRHEGWNDAITDFLDYICHETLADRLDLVADLSEGNDIDVDGVTGKILIKK